MTALPEEVESAMAEGVEIMELYAPERIEADEDGQVKALWVSQQMPGETAADVLHRRLSAPTLSRLNVISSSQLWVRASKAVTS